MGFSRPWVENTHGKKKEKLSFPKKRVSNFNEVILLLFVLWNWKSQMTSISNLEAKVQAWKKNIPLKQ